MCRSKCKRSVRAVFVKLYVLKDLFCWAFLNGILILTKQNALSCTLRSLPFLPPPLPYTVV